MPKIKIALFASGFLAVAIASAQSCKPRRPRSAVKGEGDDASFSRMSGGSCTLSGAFSEDAMTQAKYIRGELEKFMNNPKCSGLSNVFSNISATSDDRAQSQDGQGMNFYAMTREWQALRRLKSGGLAYSGLNGTGVNPQTIDLMYNARLFNMVGVDQSSIVSDKDIDSQDKEKLRMQQVKNDVELAVNYKKRLLRTAGAGIEAVGGLFDYMSRSTECPINNEGPVGALAMAGIKLLGAYAGTETLATQTQSAVQSIINYTKTRYFRNAMASIDQVQLSNSISCLIESTANTYCATRDNQALQNDMKSVNPSAFSESLRGFYILTQEMPILASWLIQLKSSQPSRQQAVVEEQISLMQVPNLLQQKRLRISGILANLRFNLSQDENSARGQVYQTMTQVDTELAGSIAPGVPDFFDQRSPPTFRLFALLGKEVPAACRPKTGGDSTNTVNVVMDADTYFRSTSFAMIGSPETAINSIQTNLDRLFTDVSGDVSIYLRRNSNQDYRAVIADFDRDSSAIRVSPRKAMVDMQNYLLDLLKKLNARAKAGAGNVGQLSAAATIILETVHRIEAILTVSDKIRNAGKELFKPGGEIDQLEDKPRRTELALGDETEDRPVRKQLAELKEPLEPKPTESEGGGASPSIASISKEMEAKVDSDMKKVEKSISPQLDEVFKLYQTFGATVVTELAMDLSQENLLPNRLARIVQFDMQELLKSINNDPNSPLMSQASQAMLKLANDTIVNNLTTAFGNNPQKLKTDLANAQYINQTTFQALLGDIDSPINRFGSSNPVVNVFNRSIGALDAKVRGKTQTPKETLAYMHQKLGEGSQTDAFFSELAWLKDYIGFRKLNLNPATHLKNSMKQTMVVLTLAVDDTIQAGPPIPTSDESTFKLASGLVGYWMRPDLYWVPGYWSGSPTFTEDEYGSLATVRAHFCMQTLAAPDPTKFETFCKGAVLYSFFEDPAVVNKRIGQSVQLGADSSPAKLTGLSLIYDDWLRAYQMNQQRIKAGQTNYFQSQRICAVYDHYRANEIYALLKPQMEFQKLMEQKGGSQ